MKHTIVAREPGGTAEIVWDDATGEVTGNHSQAAELALAIASPPLECRCPWGFVSLADPAHDPADFLTALRSIVSWPLHVVLPQSLADVEPTPYPPAPGGAMGDVVDPNAAKRLEATPDNEIFDPFPERTA